MMPEITPEIALPFRALRWLTVPPVLLERWPLPLKIGIRDDFLGMLEPGQEKALNNALVARNAGRAASTPVNGPQDRLLAGLAAAVEGREASRRGR